LSKRDRFTRWQTISGLFIAGFPLAAGLLVLSGRPTSPLRLLRTNAAFAPQIDNPTLWALFCGVGLLVALMIPFLVWLAKIARQKTREVEAAQARFAGILDMAQDAIVSVDANHRITLFNQAAEKIFGYKAHEVVNQPITILICESEPITEFAIASETSMSPERRSKVVARRKNGSTFPAEVTMSWVNLGNEVIRTAMLRDITRRQQAEEISAFLISIVNSSEGAIIGNTLDGMIASWNRGAEKLYGYTAAEAIGKPISMLVPLNLNYELAKLLEQIKKGIHIDRYEMVRIRKDGSRVDVSLTVSPIRDSSGKLLGMSTIAQDITERKRMEEQLAQSHEAALEATRLKSEFLANMSHEIRTPMNGVIGMTDLLLDSELNPAQREFGEVIQSSAKALLTLLNDILDFSKIEAGKLEFAATDFSLRDCLSGTLKAPAVRAHAKELDLAYYISPEVPDNLIGDPDRLRQIVINLVSNAIKFTEQGEVLIQVDKKWQSDTQIFLQFSVTDTGIGLAPEKQKSIFEAFVQADSSTTRRYGGTGLGLSISSRLVEMLDGKIWVESEPGKGSAFRFTARFDLQKVQPTRISSLAPESLRELPVLIVERNASTRKLIEEMCVSWRMQPTAVEDDYEALERLQEAHQTGKPFALAIIDSALLEKTAYRLSDAISLHPELVHQVILLTSTLVSVSDKQISKTLQHCSFLTKPVKPSDLLNTIMSAFKLQPARQSASFKGTVQAAERGSGLRILVAEDNPVNQLVVRKILEKRGHQVTLADNGRIALEALAQEAFDLVLMDIEMPEMNGIETTLAIRRKEQISGQHQPIMALTAHAMKEDAERFLAAGMDDYLSKPIEPNDLLYKIDCLVSKAVKSPTVSKVKGSGQPVMQRKIELSKALEYTEGDMELLQNIIRLFLKTYPGMLAEIRQTIADNNGAGLARAAHSFKGIGGYFLTASDLGMVKSLEQMGRELDLQNAKAMTVALEQELTLIEGELKTLLNEKAA
jgi:two-component system sensor histidine kinase/response regulator